MNKRLLFAAVLIAACTSLTAQFVGQGSTPSAPATQSNKLKGMFFVKFGGAFPVGKFGLVPARSGPTEYFNGVMGAKTGFFAEAGMGLSITDPDKLVGFYYFPIMASYWQTALDWSELGGFFSDKATYVKPVSVIDIAQRYGVVVKPIDNLYIAVYYRPGLIIPLDFEMTDPAGTFTFTGTLSASDEAPALMMSHTPGLSVRYMFASLSFEYYIAQPTYDIHYMDQQVGINENTTGKIPIRLLNISLSLSF